MKPKVLAEVEILAKQDGLGTRRGCVVSETMHPVGKSVDALGGPVIEVGAVLTGETKPEPVPLIVKRRIELYFHGSTSLQQHHALHMGGLGKHVEPLGCREVVSL
jgi:hypothetical protein